MMLHVRSSVAFRETARPFRTRDITRDVSHRRRAVNDTPASQYARNHSAWGDGRCDLYKVDRGDGIARVENAR